MYDYCSTQINLPEKVGFKIFSWATENLKKEWLYEESNDDSYGLEDEPHVTLLYGLLPSVTAEDLEYFIYSHNKEIPKKLEFSLTKLSFFRNENFNVMKINVAMHDSLTKMHYLLKENFPNENKFPVYKPHSTIAYLKKEYWDEYSKFQDFQIFKKCDIGVKSFIFSNRGNDKKKIYLYDFDDYITIEV